MPLHDKRSIAHKLDDEIYASSDLERGVPKYRLPAGETDPRHAYAIVHDELMLDGNARQNLATFCQTWSEPEVHRLMDECMDRNIEDKVADVLRAGAFPVVIGGDHDHPPGRDRGGRQVRLGQRSGCCTSTHTPTPLTAMSIPSELVLLPLKPKMLQFST